MFKKGLACILGLVMNSLLFASSVAVFVSFSMPENLLKETLAEAARLHIPAYLNGLYRDSMKQTALKVMRLCETIPNLNLNIDPTAFERFGIQQVPALAVEGKQGFDVIYGHLSLKEGLARMADKGDSRLSRQEVKEMLGG